MPDATSFLSAAPPGVDPADYAKLMRQQAIAQMLTESSITPPAVQQPQATKGVYIQPRISPLSVLAKLAEAYMGRIALDSSNTGLAQAYARGLQAMGGGQQQQAPQGAPAPPPGPLQGNAGGAGAMDAGQPQSVQPAPNYFPNAPSSGGSGGSSLNPMGLDPRAMLTLYMQKPDEYLKMIQGTPEWQNALRASGGNPAQAMQLMHAKMVKDATLELRQGGEALIPQADGSMQSIKSPNLPSGMDFTRDAQGNPQPYVLPGVLSYEQEQERRHKLGETQGEINTVPNKAGGTDVYFPRDFSPGYGGGQPPAPGAATAPGGAGAAPSSGAPMASPAGAPGAGVTAGPVSAQNPQSQKWAGLPVRKQPMGSGAPGIYDKVVMDKQADAQIELNARYGNEADMADQRLAFNNLALNMLPQAETGPLAEHINALRSQAQELGIPERAIPGWAKVAPSQELRKALVRNAIVSLKPSFGGRPAASEFNVLKEEANPSDKMVSLAIKRLLQVDSLNAGYQKQRAADFGEAMDRGGDPTRFETWYANRHPFNSQMENYLHPPTAAELAAEAKRRGLTP